MDGYRIMNASRYSLVRQASNRFVSVTGPNGINVVNMPSISCLRRWDDTFEFPEASVVLRGVVTAPLVGCFQLAQLDLKDRCLNPLHAAVPSNQGVKVFSFLSMIPQYSNSFG